MTDEPSTLEQLADKYERFEGLQNNVLLGQMEGLGAAATKARSEGWTNPTAIKENAGALGEQVYNSVANAYIQGTNIDISRSEFGKEIMGQLIGYTPELSEKVIEEAGLTSQTQGVFEKTTKIGEKLPYTFGGVFKDITEDEKKEVLEQAPFNNVLREPGHAADYMQNVQIANLAYIAQQGAREEEIANAIKEANQTALLKDDYT